MSLYAVAAASANAPGMGSVSQPRATSRLSLQRHRDHGRRGCAVLSSAGILRQQVEAASGDRRGEGRTRDRAMLERHLRRTKFHGYRAARSRSESTRACTATSCASSKPSTETTTSTSGTARTITRKSPRKTDFHTPKPKLFSQLRRHVRKDNTYSATREPRSTRRGQD